MRPDKAKLITSIVFGDPDRPTVSWLGRQFEKADDLTTRSINKVGIRYTARLIERELTKAGFPEASVATIKSVLQDSALRVFTVLGDRPAFAGPHPQTLGDIFGYKDQKLFHVYDLDKTIPDGWRENYFSLMRDIFTENLLKKDIRFPEKIAESAAAPAIALRQKMLKLSAGTVGFAVGTILSPFCIWIGILPHNVAGAFAEAVSTARVCPAEQQTGFNCAYNDMNFY
ncbi:MAG: hypothetical protein JWR51_4753 [Devosia sp.]|uniref:hypothetical protein n=1 Tax=Devosia sp. TaxID=1871048 RepID=UPI00262869E5|nr:hypothetical protein [Devosia sp.]MDB5531650.1 hypothetical protein [Devosia sp.]